MNTGKTLFAQLMDFLPWKSFQRIVDRYDGNYRVRTLPCAEHFRILAFAQLTYRESLRDIEALAVVDDPATAIRQLHSITERKRARNGQSVRAFNPLSKEDQCLFKSLLSGDNTINGFRNRDIRERLAGTPALHTCGNDRHKQSAKVSRLLKRLHLYGLIAKVPRSRRWRLSQKGWSLLSASVSLRENAFPRLHLQAAA